MSGAARHYLYVCGAGLMALRHEAGALACKGWFERPPPPAADGGTAAPEGELPAEVERFRRLLANHRRDRFVWLVDTIEEEQQLEQLPRVRGRDLRRVVARRVATRLHGKPLTVWTVVPTATARQPQAAESTQRWNLRSVAPSVAPRSDTVSVVLSALGSEQTLQPWLPVAQASGVRIEGIQSPALLAQALGRRLGKRVSGLMVSLHPAGLRQSLLIDGTVRFTRLAASSTRVAAEQVIGECERALQYLLMNQSVTRAQLAAADFTVWLVDNGIGGADGLPRELRVESTVVAIRRIDADALEALPITALPPAPAAATTLEPGGLGIWLQPSLWERRPAGYATAEIRLHEIRAARQRWSMTITVAALLMAMLINLGVELEDRMDAGGRRIARLNQADRKERDRLQAYADQHFVSGAEMRRVVELDTLLRRRTIDALPLLRRISDALAPDDSLRLDRITWSRNSPQSDAGAGAPASAGASPASALAPTGATALPFGSAPMPMPAGGAAVATSGPLALAMPAGVPALSGHARLVGRFDRTPAMTEANRRVEAFATRLAERCDCRTRVRRLPFDPEPTQGYSSTRGQAGQDDARFEIELQWQEPTVGDLEPAPGTRGGSDAQKG